MPNFDESEASFVADAQTLAPITIARIAKMLEALEVNYVEDEDGDLAFGFDGNACFFRVSGPEAQEIALSFNGRWRGSLPLEQSSAALRTVNEWNEAQAFPRAMCVQGEDDTIVFGADYMHDYEFGVTNAQLRNDITIAISTALHYFQALDEWFPEGLEEEANPA